MKFLPSRQGRRVFGEFCEEYDLVYFGDVLKSDDGYHRIDGLTQSPAASDSNYCAGDVYEYPVVILERTLRQPTGGKTKLGRPATRRLNWTILQISLRRARAPHIFINGRRHSDRLYASLSASFLRLTAIPAANLPAGTPADFARNFSLFAQPDALGTIAAIFPPTVAATLGAYFADFDFELNQDKLIVYAAGAVADLKLLDLMLRGGLFLARHLDSLIAEN
ncbi:MAG: hypothetical protein LBM73_02325 [Candidatus Nomurabacteria bacterium]|jgi:hypothetical protein|nr:hypothetical protein [Candidatus Nomurabacteria bacterium]